MEKYELKVDIKKIEKLLKALEKGMNITYACDLAMIPTVYVSRWNKSYKEYSELFDAGQNDGSYFLPPLDKNGNLVLPKLNAVSICCAIKYSRAKSQEKLLDKLNKADSAVELTKCQWLLERIYRDAFGKDEPVDNSKEKVESIKVIYVDPKDSKDRLKELEKKAKEDLGIKDNE